MWRVLAKTAVRVSLSRKNSYGFQPWGNTKKCVFNTYVFPSTTVMRAGNTIASPCHFGIFMRIHMRVSMFLLKHIPNVEIFAHHVYRCRHTSWTHMYLLVLEVWNLETHARFLVFFSKKQEAHARSTPACSHLLLNNRKRQDLKSCSVPLCAITFQLQPFFPWNCASLEQKKCPAIQNIRCQAKKWLSLPTLCIFLMYLLSDVLFYLPIYWFNFNMTYTIYPHLYIHIYIYTWAMF